MALWVLFGGIVLIAHAIMLSRYQKSRAQLDWEWLVIVPICIYGFLPPVVMLLAEELALEAYPDFARNYDQDAFEDVVVRYVVIISGMLLVHFGRHVITVQTMFRSPAPRCAPILDNKFKKWLFFVSVVFAVASFFAKYGGLDGYIEFISYDFRKNAYAEMTFGGGILGRLDLVAPIVASASFLYGRTLRGVSSISVLLIGAVPTLVLLLSGTRLSVITYIIVMITIRFRQNRGQFKGYLARVALFGGCLLPFFAFWGLARNAGATGSVADSGLLALVLPNEFLSGYIAPMLWHVEDIYWPMEYVGQFFPDTLLKMLGVEGFSMSGVMNSDLRGGAPAVYVVSIAGWAAFPLKGWWGVFVTITLTYAFLAMLLAVIRSLPIVGVRMLLWPALIGQVWSFVRLDPAAWFSGLWQTVVIGFIILLPAYFSSKIVLVSNRRKPVLNHAGF